MSIIQAITWALVLTSGAGISTFGPMKAWISVVYRRVRFWTSVLESSFGLTLQQAADGLTDAQLGDLRRLRAELDQAIIAESELADKAFSGQRFSGTGQAPWREMWEAARRFVESSGGTFPPGGPAWRR